MDSHSGSKQKRKKRRNFATGKTVIKVVKSDWFLTFVAADAQYLKHCESCSYLDVLKKRENVLRLFYKREDKKNYTICQSGWESPNSTTPSGHHWLHTVGRARTWGCIAGTERKIRRDRVHRRQQQGWCCCRSIPARGGSSESGCTWWWVEWSGQESGRLQRCVNPGERGWIVVGLGEDVR